MSKIEDRFEFLDPKLLSLFDLIHSTGSVTRAAEQLGQSQPTVSIWLSKLRLALHDPLFVRTPKGMLPTPRADALIGSVRQALDSLRHISQQHAVFDPANAKRRFRISMTDAGDITMLPKILAHLFEVAPEISIETIRIGSDTGQRLISGEMDLALGLVPELDSGFYQQALYEEEWVCLCKADHPRAGSIMSISDYEREAHIAITTRTGELLQAAIKRQRINRTVLLELPGFLGLPAILSGSHLIATLPRGIGEALARSSSGLTAFPSPVQAPTLTIKQYWHERYHQVPANRWLRSMCAELFARKGVSSSAVTIGK
jgi:DNA-binding transcriptional LysR family regulator